MKPLTPEFIASMPMDNHLKESVRNVVAAIDANDRYEYDLGRELVAISDRHRAAFDFLIARDGWPTS